jgi:hypothetical protein
MPLMKTDVLKYLEAVQANYSAYHNHKETSAWGAAAVYAAIVVQISGGATSASNDLERLSRIVGILLLAGAVVRYVWKQFELREVAGNQEVACLALMAESLLKEDREFLPESFELSRSPDSTHATPYVMPRIITDKVAELKNKGQGSRRTLENTMYFALTAVTLAGIAMIWFR